MSFDQNLFQYPAGICLLKVSNRNTRTRCEICSKLTIKTPKRRQSRNSSVSSVSIVNIERVIAGWGVFKNGPNKRLSQIKDCLPRILLGSFVNN